MWGESSRQYRDSEILATEYQRTLTRTGDDVIKSSEEEEEEPTTTVSRLGGTANLVLRPKMK